ncbi:8783_t:CDS:1, partial [Funneliformis geosporum]
AFRQPNSNISMTVDSDADHSIITINSQTLRNYFDRILAGQAKCWYSTGLSIR